MYIEDLKQRSPLRHERVTCSGATNSRSRKRSSGVDLTNTGATPYMPGDTTKSCSKRSSFSMAAVEFSIDENRRERAAFALTNQHIKVRYFHGFCLASGERALPFEIPTISFPMSMCRWGDSKFG